MTSPLLFNIQVSVANGYSVRTGYSPKDNTSTNLFYLLVDLYCPRDWTILSTLTPPYETN